MDSSPNVNGVNGSSPRPEPNPRSPPGASPASREVSREAIRPRPTARGLHRRGPRWPKGPREREVVGWKLLNQGNMNNHEHGAWNISKSHETRLTCFNHQTRQHNLFVNHEYKTKMYITVVTKSNAHK